MCQSLLSQLRVAFFPSVGPALDEAVVMLRALRLQHLLFVLPPGSPGANGELFAIPKTLEKCNLIVNLVPVNGAMPQKPQKFSLTSVEVFALLAQLAQQGLSFCLRSFHGRAWCLRPVWELLGLLGRGGGV